MQQDTDAPAPGEDPDESGPGVSEEDRQIGHRARRIRKRRGLSLDVVAHRAGISKSQLSRLETGTRGWTRRGLIEDVAAAMSCSVADLTGQPYMASDQLTAMAAAGMSELVVAVHDATLVDAPDLPARPVHELVSEARWVNELADQVEYGAGAYQLAKLLTELQIHISRGDEDTRREALPALVEACMAAQGYARTMGNSELALTIARRGYDAARMAERPDLVALMAMNRGHALMRIGARYQAASVLTAGIEEAAQGPGPSRKDTRLAEGRGMLHLSSALLGARSPRHADTETHLEEARALAAYVGEGNHMRYHFGPTNVETWGLSIGVDQQLGPEAAERFLRAEVNVERLGSRDRQANVHFDLARAWGQAEGPRDDDAVRHLDLADRIAPLRTRNDPLAGELAGELRRRARRRMWELDSLCNRFGVA